MRFFILLLIGTMPLFVQAGADASAGEALYASCTVCHGGNAEGNQALAAPRLSHLDPVDIVVQLENFRTGVRGGVGSSSAAMQMAPMAGVLQDSAAVENVAAYIASLPSVESATTVSGDTKLGRDYYNQFCSACHGAQAQGNHALNSPRLAGASDWYLEAQLNAFREGVRGTHPEDRTGRQMRAMAGVLPDDVAIQAVVAFIGSL